MSKRRVVVTGMGALTPIGNNLDEYWNGLKEGKSGANLITKFDAEKFDTKFACEVKNFDPLTYIDRKAARRMDPYTQYAVATSTMAMEHSGLDKADFNKEMAGVIFGSGIGGMDTWEKQHTAFMGGGPKKISPFFVPMMISDIAAGQISIMYGLKGPNYATTSACATSTHAIADAFIHIQRGSANVMVCGGAEAAITPMAVGGFNAARALSTWNDKYLEASRPFDKDRNGFVMGEGSASMVLEEYEHAVKRGATIHGEIIGVGLTGDAYHVTAPAPGGEGAQRSMAAALRDGGITPDKVDYINAHGTSTQLNDINESNAIRVVFGDQADKLVVSSTKSMTGHLLGAAGGVEAIATVLSIQNSLITPTINHDEPDPECTLDYNAKKLTEKNVDYAITNTFGFGGHNATLLFKKFEG